MTSWHILGAGAMGCLWGANLSRSNHQVELLLKDQTSLEQFNKTTRITLRQGVNKSTYPVNAGLAAALDHPIDNLLVTTKSHQTMTALGSVAHLLTNRSTIFLLQNGMGVAEQVAEKFPDVSLFCGVTTEGAYCPEPFTVVHAGVGTTLIGSFQKPTDPSGLIDQLPGDYLNLEACEDIQNAQWQKLVVNCAINGLTALFQCRNGKLLTIPEAGTRLKRLCDEIDALEKALKLSVQDNSVYENAVSVIQLTADNYSSMYQDIHNRRLTEIDYINGYLISKAEAAGISCPENKQLVQEIKALEMNLGCI